MTEIAVKRLNIQSGLIEAVVEESQVSCEVSMTIKPWSSEQRAEFTAFVAKDAHLLHKLLQNHAADDFEEWLLNPLEELVESSACSSCETQECPHARPVIASVKQRVAEQPAEGLLLVGYSASECTAAVFASWSAALPDAQGALAATAQKLLDEKGSSAGSPGEWLYEAALQDQLHEPGPQLLEVQIDLTKPYAIPTAGKGKSNPAEGTLALRELLPGVPDAEKALQLIRREASEKADARRKLLEA